MLGVKSDQISGWYHVLTSQVMDCQVHAIGKAIRSLFADPVTFFKHLLPHDDCSIRVF